MNTAEFVTNKNESKGIALIDDKLNITRDDQTSWEQILFMREYSEHVSTAFPTINDWNDEKLESILNNIKGKDE